MERGHDPNRVHQSVLPQPSRAGGGISGGGEPPTKTQWKTNVLGSFNFGDYSNEIARIEGPDETHFFNADAEGKILNIGELNENAKEYAKYILTKYLGDIQDVGILIVKGLNIGDDVPNWEDYQTLES